MRGLASVMYLLLLKFSPAERILFWTRLFMDSDLSFAAIDVKFMTYGETLRQRWEVANMVC